MTGFCKSRMGALAAAMIGVVGLAGMSTHAAVLEVGAGQTYDSISAAYDAASDGDTINIHAGTYSSGLSRVRTDTTPLNNITFQANKNANGQYDKVVIQANQNPMRYGSGLTFDGLIFYTPNGGGYANYLRYGFSDATFTNDIFYAPSGRGFYAYGGNGSINNITIENATFYGNADNAIWRRDAVNDGWVIKDSLFVDNGAVAINNADNNKALSIDYSAFYNNGSDGNQNVTGNQKTPTLGAGTTTDVAPIFVSTDINDPYFLYLDPSSPLSILTGDSQGGFKGARGVVPEPTSAAVMAMCLGGLFVCRRRISKR